jgi:hypothetical protein
MAVVRFVANVAWGRDRDCLDDLAVFGRLLVEVDDCQKIGSNVSLVSGPNVEGFVGSWPLTVALITSDGGLGERNRRPREKAQNSGHGRNCTWFHHYGTA